MAKNNGDLALMKDGNGIYHITLSASKCLCGKEWSYGTIDRIGKAQNIVYRNIDAVTCEKCKEIHSM